jgi:hypothetical protein
MTGADAPEEDFNFTGRFAEEAAAFLADAGFFGLLEGDAGFGWIGMMASLRIKSRTRRVATDLNVPCAA